MFRRDEGPDGPTLYTATGLWGSGNVVSDRGIPVEETTGFTMWDGHALWGPGRPGSLEPFPALVGIIEAETFVERYASLGDENCALWVGDEELGVGCELACGNVVDACPSRAFADCVAGCEGQPRMVVDCIAASSGCPDEEKCIQTPDDGPGKGYQRQVR